MGDGAVASPSGSAATPGAPAPDNQHDRRAGDPAGDHHRSPFGALDQLLVGVGPGMCPFNHPPWTVVAGGRRPRRHNAPVQAPGHEALTEGD